jgi:superfamily II DNA/RNA helicase/cold shock CspA family protein
MTAPSPTFADLGVAPPLAEQLARGGIDHPFPIQAAVLPDALAGRDICGRAPTGSGKTLAFGLPLVTDLSVGERRRPTALVLSPTRELAEQIAADLRPLARVGGADVVAIYGGVGYGGQKAKLDRGTEVVVACPGRLEDLLQQGALTLDRVDRVVVDEADRMADMGFLPAVRRILSAARPDRQTMLFSATLEGPVSKLTRDFQRDPARHEVGSTEPDMEASTHLFWKVERPDRVARAAAVVKKAGPTIVFCRTRRGADRVARQLERTGVSAAPIHGARSQNQRDRALKSFADGRVAALVATDVAARGIHVDGVAAVVHLDPPEDASTYLHRSGRTARAGASGVVVSLVPAELLKDTRAVQRALGLEPGMDAIDLDLVRIGEGMRNTGDQAAPPGPQADGPRSRSRTHPESGARGPRRAGPSRPGPVGPAAGEQTLTGTVRFFDARKGYGFITREGQPDLFVHHSNVAGEGFRKLEGGQQVAFDLKDGRKGPEACNVQAA